MLYYRFNGTQPRQDLSKDEIIKMYDRNNPASAIDRWYLENVRFVALDYNRRTTPLSTNVADNYGLWGRNGEADKAYRLATLFQGNQGIDDYGWLTQIDGNDALPLPYNPGQEARMFMRFIANQYLKIAKNSKPVVKSYDYKSQSLMKKKIQRAMFRYDMKPFFKEISEQFGIDVKVEGYDEFSSKEQIEKFFFQNATTTAEIYGTDLLHEIRRRNNIISKAFQTFLHLLISGRCMTENYKRNGWAMIDVIPPWCQIYTSVQDDDFGEYMVRGGWVRQFTPNSIATKKGLFGKSWGEQIVEKYGASELEKILKATSDMAITGDDAYPNYNFNWNRVANNNIVTYTVVRAYWESLVDSRALPDKRDPDNKLFYLSEKMKKKGDMVKVWRTATVINDMWVVDEGVCDEIVDPIDKGQLYCPIQVFQPYTLMGYNKSLLEEVEAIQKDMSMIDFKFREMVGFDFGMIMELNGAKFLNANTSYEVMEELKKVRVLIKTKSGDPNNPLDNEREIGTINMSTVEFAMKYVELWRMLESKMKDALNLSDISMGTNSSYVGFRSQQESIDTASTPLQYHIFGHVQFMTNVMQYSLEQQRLMVQTGETNPAEEIIGQRGVVFIKEMKKNLFGTLLCRVDVDDYIDEKRKQGLLNDMRALLPTGTVDLEDLVSVESMNTWSEIRSYVKMKREQSKANQEQQMLFDKIMGLIGQQKQIQGQQDMAAMQVEAGLIKEGARNETKLAGDMMKYDAATMGMEQAGLPAQG
jgi:hypothetical protein